MTRRLRIFARFCWDFVVGDDWRIAAAILGALVVMLVASSGTHGPWWLLPIVVATVLLTSVWTAARGARRG